MTGGPYLKLCEHAATTNQHIEIAVDMTRSPHRIDDKDHLEYRKVTALRLTTGTKAPTSDAQHIVAQLNGIDDLDRGADQILQAVASTS